MMKLSIYCCDRPIFEQPWTMGGVAQIARDASSWIVIASVFFT